MVLDIILFSENRNFMTFICRISHFLHGSSCIKDTEEHRQCLSCVGGGEQGLQQLPHHAATSLLPAMSSPQAASGNGCGYVLWNSKGGSLTIKSALNICYFFFLNNSFIEIYFTYP